MHSSYHVHVELIDTNVYLHVSDLVGVCGMWAGEAKGGERRESPVGEQLVIAPFVIFVDL